MLRKTPLKYPATSPRRAQSSNASIFSVAPPSAEPRGAANNRSEPAPSDRLIAGSPGAVWRVTSFSRSSRRKPLQSIPAPVMTVMSAASVRLIQAPPAPRWRLRLRTGRARWIGPRGLERIPTSWLVVDPEADVQVLSGCDHDGAAESRKEFGESLEEQPALIGAGRLPSLRQHPGKPVRLAVRGLNDPVVAARGRIGDLADLTFSQGLAAIAIFEGAGDGLAAIAASPVGIGKRRRHRGRRRQAAQPHRHDRYTESLLVGQRLNRACQAGADLSPPGRQELIDSALRQRVNKGRSRESLYAPARLGASGTKKRPHRERGIAPGTRPWPG